MIAHLLLALVSVLGLQSVADAAAMNPQLLSIPANTWVNLTQATGQSPDGTGRGRILCSSYRVNGTWGASQFTPTRTNQNRPTSRGQTGMTFGIVKGRPSLIYFGGAHQTHPCNDVEIFDVATGVWTQQYVPEASRLWNGNVTATNGTNTLTLDTTAPTFNAFGGTNAIAFGANPNTVVGHTPSPGYLIASYDGPTRTVTIQGTFSSPPVVGHSAGIWDRDNNAGRARGVGGNRGLEAGGNPLYLSPLGRPHADHTQDYCKYDVNNERYLCLWHVGTMAFDPVTRRWSYISGPLNAKFSPSSSVGKRALLEYDDDLRRTTGTSGFQAITTDRVTGVVRGKYIMQTDGTWAQRGGGDNGLPNDVNVAGTNPYLTYTRALRKHIVRFENVNTAQFHWYLYDAVADVWTRLIGMPNIGSSFAYDDVNNALIGLEYGPPGTIATAVSVQVCRVTTDPVSCVLEANQPPCCPIVYSNGGSSGLIAFSAHHSGNMRYDSVHQVMLLIRMDSGSGGTGSNFVEVWAYRYRRPRLP